MENVFEGQRMELEERKSRWLKWFIVNILVLFILAILIFFGPMASAGFGKATWLEFAVALPLVYSAIFFHAQYSRAREYAEEYAWKSLVARSMGGYLELLKKEVNHAKAEEQKKYLDFMVDAIGILYASPREAISKHPLNDEEDVKVGVVEKLGEVFKKFIPGNIS
ncbi:hypothetical protein M1413_02240 [Patescibacteria group bacterium]|nr:hypothetical protein [Patescibacteria group bacterium]MCL5114811.1 hypothetical protein [Patescibacteria group bacterium]